MQYSCGYSYLRTETSELPIRPQSFDTSALGETKKINKLLKSGSRYPGVMSRDMLKMKLSYNTASFLLMSFRC